ncbi:MAG: ParM/StbA family protein [Clostridia bacterium]|nr:ParM/StbA family protein [Clostridia bacterium]
MTNILTNKNETIVIGIDHGFGNIKTAHCCFRSGIKAHEKEPAFKDNMLIYQDKYYLIGQGHKEFNANKITNIDYYILTLAAIAKELDLRHITSAKVHIAAGLPLTWVSEQKEDFKAYLLQNETAAFTFNDKNYHIEFVGADVFPQGFSAVCGRLREFFGTNMLADIGNGTMNIMYINDCRPVPDKCFTEKFGVNQCMLAIREEVLKKHGTLVPEDVIEQMIRKGTANISDKFLSTIKETAAEYVNGIFRILRERELNLELMRLFVAGGGSCMIKHFGEYDSSRVIIIDDICAAAKGYELLAWRKLHKGGAL